MQAGGETSFVGVLNNSVGVTPVFTGFTLNIKYEYPKGITTVRCTGHAMYMGRTVSYSVDLTDRSLDASSILSEQEKQTLMLKTLNAAYEAMSVAMRKKEYQEVNN